MKKGIKKICGFALAAVVGVSSLFIPVSTQTTHALAEWEKVFKAGGDIVYYVNKPSEVYIQSHSTADLTKMMYGAAELKESIDYTVKEVIMDSEPYTRITFTEKFIDDLSIGSNRIELYGKPRYSSEVQADVLYIYKLDKDLNVEYKPEYPEVEEPLFVEDTVYATKRSNNINFKLNEYKEISKILLDHADISKIWGKYDYSLPREYSYGYPNLYFSFPLSLVGEEKIGIHCLEVVVDGHSQVLKLVVLNEMDDILNVDKISTWKRDSEIDPTYGFISGIEDLAGVQCETEVGGSINQRYTISCMKPDKSFDLKNMKVRYYYKKNGDKKQVFACDHAGIQCDRPPYYIDCSKNVKGKFGDGYVDIYFDMDDSNITDDVFNFGIRLYQEDWSAYEDVESGKIEVISLVDGDTE